MKEVNTMRTIELFIEDVSMICRALMHEAQAAEKNALECEMAGIPHAEQWREIAQSYQGLYEGMQKERQKALYEIDDTTFSIEIAQEVEEPKGKRHELVAEVDEK